MSDDWIRNSWGFAMRLSTSVLGVDYLTATTCEVSVHHRHVEVISPSTAASVDLSLIHQSRGQQVLAAIGPEQAYLLSQARHEHAHYTDLVGDLRFDLHRTRVGSL
jgi:hypothetical protein